MATAYKIQIDPSRVGLLGYKHNEAAAAKLSELLQKDLDMAHHLCTLYGAGATPKELQAAFDSDAEIQIDQFQLNYGVLEDLRRDWAANALPSISEMPSTIPISCDISKSKLCPFFHPAHVRHRVGDQPAIIAQGLAQSAIHDTYVGDFLAKVDKAAAAKPPSKRLNTCELYEQVHSDPDFVNSVRNGKPNKILNGVEVLCPDEGVEYLAQFKADPNNLAEGITENIHAAAYMASACVFHPPDYPRFDFFLIHHLTIGPFLLLIQDATWIPDSVKLQTLEWKTRFDILHYVVRWGPAPATRQHQELHAKRH
ncbi:hypothetical protein ACHAO4_007184 [Trichoderma viride]